MESFSLFDFLKTLLPAPAEPPKNEAVTQPPAEKETPPAELPFEETPPPSQDAILNFLQVHEQRARSVKRK